MMNFEKDRIEKLRRTDEQHRSAADLMIPGEASIGLYKGSDFQVTFTDRKVLIVNVRGITGKKIDVTVIPYSKVDIFSVEGHGDIGNDGALVLRVGGQNIRFEFDDGNDLVDISSCITKSLS